MPVKTLLAIAVCLVGLGGCGDEEKDPPKPEDTCAEGQTYELVAEPFLEANCFQCHSDATAENLGNGHAFTSEEEVFEHGHIMYENVETGIMPPAGQKKPSEPDKAKFLAWLECSGAAESGEGHH